MGRHHRGVEPPPEAGHRLLERRRPGDVAHGAGVPPDRLGDFPPAPSGRDEARGDEVPLVQLPGDARHALSSPPLSRYIVPFGAPLAPAPLSILARGASGQRRVTAR